MEALDQHHQ
jgi:hypothetical protein